MSRLSVPLPWLQKLKAFTLRGMVVLPSARGILIGYRLLDEIQRFAIGERCGRLFLSTTPFLGRTIRLYEAFGFRRTDDEPQEGLDSHTAG